jgi:hypothetical protein
VEGQVGNIERRGGDFAKDYYICFIISIRFIISDCFAEPIKNIFRIQSNIQSRIKNQKLKTDVSRKEKKVKRNSNIFSAY